MKRTVRPVQRRSTVASVFAWLLLCSIVGGCGRGDEPAGEAPERPATNVPPRQGDAVRAWDEIAVRVDSSGGAAVEGAEVEVTRRTGRGSTKTQVLRTASDGSAVVRIDAAGEFDVKVSAAPAPYAAARLEDDSTFQEERHVVVSPGRPGPEAAFQLEQICVLRA